MIPMQMFTDEERMMKAILETRTTIKESVAPDLLKRMANAGWLQRFVDVNNDFFYTTTNQGVEAYSACHEDFEKRMKDMERVTQARVNARLRDEVVNQPDCSVNGLLLGSLDELPIWARTYIQFLRGMLYEMKGENDER